MIRSVSSAIVRSKVAQRKKNAKKRFLPWDQVRSVALVISDADRLSKNEIDVLVKRTGKHVEVLYTELRSKLPSYADLRCLTRKSRNIWGLPTAACIRQCLETKSDLLIVLNPEQSVFISYLAAVYPCSFSAGDNDVFGELDLIVERKKGLSAELYLEELLRYLKMIRN